MFFKYFASKNQLPGLSIIGTLVENGLIAKVNNLNQSDHKNDFREHTSLQTTSPRRGRIFTCLSNLSGCTFKRKYLKLKKKMSGACNFTKKEVLTYMLSNEFCKISKPWTKVHR